MKIDPIHNYKLGDKVPCCIEHYGSSVAENGLVIIASAQFGRLELVRNWRTWPPTYSTDFHHDPRCIGDEVNGIPSAANRPQSNTSVTEKPL